MNYFHAKSDSEIYSNIKIEYHDPTDTGRVVSQTFSHKESRGEEPLLKARKILSHVENSGNNLPRIAIKREIRGEEEGEVILLNSGWDSCINKKIKYPEIMHNVQNENISAAHHQTVIYKDGIGEVSNSVSPRGSDSGIESDCADGNLSWLLNYKIRELPPFPDSGSTDNLTENESQIVTTTSHPVPVNEIFSNEGYKVMQESRDNLLRKPPFTYTELIEHALCEKGQLTVSGIYSWISKHFPFYKANDDRWKNSVRHNLSINPHFRKGGKAAHGAGHLWTIASRDETKSWKMRQKINEFLRVSGSQKNPISDPQDAFDKELQAATDSILEEIQSQTRMESTTVMTNNIQQTTEVNDDDIHVEFINLPEGVTGLEGFLSPPVSKQDIVNECGLGTDDFFITDINPNQLGLNLIEPEANDDRIYEEMTLEYYGIKE